MEGVTRPVEPGLIGIEKPGPVGVREQRVVELGQEAWRGRHVGLGSGGVGKVDELTTGLVVKDADARSEALHHLPQAGEA